MRLPWALLIAMSVAVLIELTLISFPLTFLLALVLFSVTTQFRYLLPGAILLIIGDALLLYPLGVSLLGVLIVMVLLELYAYYFGSKDLVVYILFILIGVALYAFFFGYSIADLIRWYFFVGFIWIGYRLLPKRFSV